jgi:predicted CXXCH cytochrome family protein
MPGRNNNVAATLGQMGKKLRSCPIRATLHFNILSLLKKTGKKGERVMKRSIIVCLAIGLLLAVGSSAMAAGGGITATLHDLSVTGTGGIAVGTATETRICVFCHAPHNPTAATAGPLWNHTMSGATTFTPYSNPLGAMKSGLTPGNPGAVSKLCLSCHDGSIAVNAYGGAAGSGTQLSGRFQIGAVTAGNSDLSKHHPVGIDYTAAMVAEDANGLGGLNDPSTAFAGNNAVMISDVLKAGMVECVSCHSVHDKNNTGSKFLWTDDNTQSQLCLTCHDK